MYQAAVTARAAELEQADQALKARTGATVQVVSGEETSAHGSRLRLHRPILLRRAASLQADWPRAARDVSKTIQP